MHIAAVNSFPCLVNTPEVEYIKRLAHAADKIGCRVYEVITSDDIHACQPDFVLPVHEFTPKLTPYFTLGVLWSPPSHYEADPRRVKSILSYDAYLVGSPQVGRFLDDLEFATGVHKPRSSFRFLPTTQSTEFVPRPTDQAYELVYVGAHWDGPRHGELLAGLSGVDEIALYGPEDTWQAHGRSYRGTVPFDGTSVLGILARHGVALCIHRHDHRVADTPSMRLFEAAAAGCLIISDEIPFARQVLGDSAFYVDLRRDPRETVAQVLHILRWARRNHAAATAMAAESHRILRDEFSIETTLQRCCEFVGQVTADVGARQSAAINRLSATTASVGAEQRALVDIIVRTGDRDLAFLRRALRSVAAQTVGHYRIILADYKSRTEVRALAAAECTSNMHIYYLSCPDTRLRSNSLWSALGEVKAPYFAMLDDDDSIMPQHFPSLIALADQDPGRPLYYSGVVRVEENPGDYIISPNFAGPLWSEVRENRELKFLDHFNLPRLIAFDNYIQSNAWIARSELLDLTLLVDPQVSVGEDMYLYLMLARAGRFKCTFSPTAYWYWRSSDCDNSMLQVNQETWARDGRKVIRRLSQQVFPGGLAFCEIRQLLDRSEIGASPIYPVVPGKLSLGTMTLLGPTIVAHTRQLNLHPPKADGVWTAAPEAYVQIRLTDAVGPMRLRLLFKAAANPARERQVVRLCVNGQEIFRGNVTPWQLIEIERDLECFPAVHALFIRAQCRYTVNPRRDGLNDEDFRDLGVFLSSLACSPVAGSSPHMADEEIVA